MYMVFHTMRLYFSLVFAEKITTQCNMAHVVVHLKLYLPNFNTY